MTDATDLFRDEARRDRVRAHAGLNGIDDIVADPSAPVLRLRLFKLPERELRACHVRIDGGSRVRDIVVLAVRHEPDEAGGPGVHRVSVDRRGDHSVYTLRLVDDGGDDDEPRPAHGFDPACATIAFRFREPGDPAPDCRASPRAASTPIGEPDIDYLAKDYASFRRLILDRLALRMPAWTETHVPDVGIALVEALAYSADLLSYQQDAVATEAYLGTAQRRISVRRHARLVDYRMHEGCNARTWVRIVTDADVTLDASGVRFVSDWAPDLPPGGVVDAAALDGVPFDDYLAFEPVSPASIRVRAAHGHMRLHAWGSRHFVLPRGATRATLIDAAPVAPPAEPAAAGKQEAAPQAGPADAGIAVPTRVLDLSPGDFVLLQQERSAATGRVADADPRRRHVVRLTRVSVATDPLLDRELVEIEWSEADALPFALTVSAIGPAPGCEVLGGDAGPDLASASANIVLVEQGRRVRHEVLAGPVPIAASGQACEGAGRPTSPRVVAGRFRPVLTQGPVVHRAPVTRRTPAAEALRQDPSEAAPSIRLRAIPGLDDGSGPVFDPADLDDAGPLAIRLAAVLRADGKPPRATDDVATARSANLLALLDPALDALLRAVHPAQPIPAATVKAVRDALLELQQSWTVRPDLIDSGPDDRHVVAEIDDAVRAQLRFGDDTCGRRPDAGSVFIASYRVGPGEAGNGSRGGGNAGSGVLRRVVLRDSPGAILNIDNPLPLVGAIAPQTLDEVRRIAPTAIRATRVRAVTADDYAELAMLDSRVQRAAATLRWNGSRYVVRVAIDPLGSGTVTDELLQSIARRLAPARRLGHDVEVVQATRVALDIAMEAEVRSGFHASDVGAALRSVFGATLQLDGTTAAFHPDRFSFGTAVEASRLIALAQRVEGVDSVRLTRLERLFIGPDGELDSGVLPIGPLEVARLDDDPDFPEHGRFRLHLRRSR